MHRQAQELAATAIFEVEAVVADVVTGMIVVIVVGLMTAQTTEIGGMCAEIVEGVPHSAVTTEVEIVNGEIARHFAIDVHLLLVEVVHQIYGTFAMDQHLRLRIDWDEVREKAHPQFHLQPRI